MPGEPAEPQTRRSGASRRTRRSPRASRTLDAHGARPLPDNRVGTPLSRETIIGHSANTHAIPADVLVARELRRLRAGQTVTLTGELVDGVRDDGASFHTSLTRTDTGAGACEVMLVREIEVEPYP